MGDSESKKSDSECGEASIADTDTETSIYSVWWSSIYVGVLVAFHCRRCLLLEFTLIMYSCEFAVIEESHPPEGSFGQLQ